MTYTEYFGLSEAPFGVTPDPRFIYPHSTYKEAFATLRYGIEARKGFVLVSGGAGTGKTTLLRMLIRSLDPTARITLISSIPVDFLELLRTILNDFQLPPIADDRRIMMGQLNHFLIQELRRRRIVCLFVDNAHELSDQLLEEIRLLSNLETDRVKLLQIALLGRAELETKLEQPQLWQLKQRFVLRRRLQPLSSSEVGSYVRARLQAAGYRRRDLFLPEAVEAIAAYSNGIPQLINVICDNALVMACAASKKEISLALIEEVARELQLDTRELQLERSAQAKDESPRPVTDRAEATEVVYATPDRESLNQPWQVAPVRLRGGYRRRTVKSSPWIAVGMLFGLMAVAAASLLLYSREIGNPLWKLPAELSTDVMRARQRQPTEGSPPPVHPKTSSERFYLHDPANGDPSPERLIPRVNTIAEKKYDIIDEPEITTPAAHTNQRGSAGDQSKGAKGTAPVSEGRPSPAAQTMRPRAKNNERPEARERFFDVVASSFVRDRPRSDANIIATLQPGTRVRLLAKRGEYFEVSWLNHTIVRGYVHREDAFFEPAHTGPAPRSRIENRR